jgi:hypothetical protein
MRFDVLFSLRYAERVLERYGRMWERLDTLLRFVAILFGSAAFAALVGGHESATLALGVGFAITQALEFSLAPARHAALAGASRKSYSAILARQGVMTDGELTAAWEAATSLDEIVVPEVLRRIAYNDVLKEKGCEMSHAFPDSSLQTLAGWLA